VGRQKVHDEQLRVRLLDTAGNLLESEGVEALSMRRLAAAAGTSTTAVYSLFGGRPGLLQALLAEAFTRLGVHLDTVAPSNDPLADIQALRRVYRAFATSDPHRYNIMASSLLGWAGEMSTCFFSPLVDAVRRAITQGVLPDIDPVTIATALWATLHGMVSLELGHAILPQAGSPSEVFETAIRADLDGWRMSPSLN
jgi:AcrR family transcriptional regulator